MPTHDANGDDTHLDDTNDEIEDAFPRDPTAAHWEQVRACTSDNLAAARAILKDAGNVTHWSRTLMTKIAKRQAAAQDMPGEGSGETSFPQELTYPEEAACPKEDPSEAVTTLLYSGTSLYSGSSLVVIRIPGDLDLAHSPPLLALLRSLTADLVQETPAGEAGLEDNQEPVPLSIVKIPVPSAEARGQSRQPPVVVDLRCALFLDAAGVSCLVDGRKALAAQGLRLMVLLPSGQQPERVFHLMHLGKIITPLSSLDEL